MPLNSTHVRNMCLYLYYTRTDIRSQGPLEPLFVKIKVLCYNISKFKNLFNFWEDEKMDDLSGRQKEILLHIVEELKDKGYPPSVREIGKAVGLKSPASVHNHLKTLERLDYIRRDPDKPRAIEVLFDYQNRYATDTSSKREVVSVPLLGRVTAGAPVLSEENIEDYFPLPLDYFNPGNKDLFMLRVQGKSMKDAGINDGDLVVAVRQATAQNDDIVIALLENETTVKRYYKTNEHIELRPENEEFEVIKARDVNVLGKVIGLFRKIS